jgi:hypothetical protein
MRASWKLDVGLTDLRLIAEFSSSHVRIGGHLLDLFLLMTTKLIPRVKL